MERKRINSMVLIASFVLLAASGAPADPINVLSIRLFAGLLGTDMQKTNLTGTLMAELDLDVSSDRPVPTGITLNGGRVEASDERFQFLRGAIAVELSNLAAFPTTPSPPGTGTMHIILAVTDHGTPRLTRYPRVLVDVKP